MLSTLLDAAPAGRRRPSVGEMADLIAGGVRCRFGLRGPGAVASACLTVIVGVLLASAMGAWVGWRDVASLASTEAATAIARTAIEQPPAAAPQRKDYGFGYELPGEPGLLSWFAGGGDDYGPGHVRFTYRHAATTNASRDIASAAHDRLRADGWRIVHRDLAASSLVARKGTAQVWVGTVASDETQLDVTRVEPAGVGVKALAGGAIGGVLAWLVLTWVLRRSAGQPLPVQAATWTLYIGGLAAMTPAAALAAAGVIFTYLVGEPVFPWIGLVMFPFRPLALLGALGALAAVVIVASPWPLYRRQGSLLP